MKYWIYIVPLIAIAALYGLYINMKRKEQEMNELAKNEIEVLLLEFNRQGDKFPTLRTKILENVIKDISPEQTLIREAIFIAMETKGGMVKGVKIPRYVWLHILDESMKA